MNIQADLQLEDKESRSTLNLSELPTLHPNFIRLVSCFRTVNALHLFRLSNQSFREVAQIITRLPQLRRLRVSLCRWNRAIPFPASNRRVRFEKLYCANFHGTDMDMVDWLGSRLDLSEFSALHLTILVDSDVVKLHHILQNRTHHLTYLYLCLMGTDDNSYGEPCTMGLYFMGMTCYLQNPSRCSVTPDWNALNLVFFGNFKQDISVTSVPYLPVSSSSFLPWLSIWLSPFLGIPI